MKRSISGITIALFTFALISVAATASAQSSGSFNYASDLTACTDIGGLLGGGTQNTALTTTLKVSSGNGVALVIRPSAVTGLLTDTTISKAFSTGSAQASIAFQVSVTPLSGQAAPVVTPGAPVTYDDRFIQISSNIFSALSGCTDSTGAPQDCFFSLDETTLSAHSFDFVATGLSAGNYKITVSWTPSTTASAPNSALACVGPVVLTATQAKIFNQSTGITF